MAIDFIICVLLLISLAINLLALGAFWVTPGLRTTANRFVINLLVVNIIGSIALAPILFLNNTSNNNDSVINSGSTELNSFIATGTINQKNNTTKTLSTAVQCNNSRCETIIVESDRNSNRILIAELENDHYGDHNDIYDNSDDSVSLPESDDENAGDEEQPIFEGDYYETDEDLHKSHSHDHRRPYQYQSRSETSSKRCWSLDLAAALGALSVLLVVGDTWCAVTDPLRYHSRISGLKAWILIAITWFLGIFFGVLSALRDNAFVSTNSNSAPLESRQDHEFIVKNDPMQIDYSSVITIHPNELYNMIFSCFYFIVIILLPFGFVCGMYWRIFSEARENGLRMRQNGSSPLLQSALNLSPSANQNQMVKDQSSIALNTGISGGLTMKIDRTSSEKEVTKPLLMATPIHKPSHHSSGEDNLNMDLEDHQHHEIIRPDRNQNILLTLSTANDELRRNYSARQLYLLGSSQDLTETGGKTGAIRHVHSTPNFQKFVHGFTASVGDPHGHHHHNSHHALQLPAVHIPPKALSYMTSIRHRLSNASSLFKYREESRAARISILVVIMFLISYLPYGLLVLLQSRITNLFANSTQVAIFMVLMAYLSSPFIFAYRNKRVRRGVKRLFGLDAKYRERKIHRSGGLLRSGTKASINVRRSASKASTYSVSSCKYLTPHAVSNGTFIMEVEKSHYLKNGYQLPQQQQLLLNGKDNFVASDKCDQSHQTILKDLEKRSILKKVCDSSRKLGCATNSCATSDNEQTDV